MTKLFCCEPRPQLPQSNDRVLYSDVRYRHNLLNDDDGISTQKMEHTITLLECKNHALQHLDRASHLPFLAYSKFA